MGKAETVLKLCLDKLPLKSLVKLTVLSKSWLKYLTSEEFRLSNVGVAHYFRGNSDAIIMEADLDEAGRGEMTHHRLPTGWSVVYWGAGIFLLREADITINKFLLWNLGLRRVVVVPAPHSINQFVACMRFMGGRYKLVHGTSLLRDDGRIRNFSTLIYDIESGIWSDPWTSRAPSRRMRRVDDLKGGLALEDEGAVFWLVNLNHTPQRPGKWSVLALRLIGKYGKSGSYDEIRLPNQIASLDKLELAILPRSGVDRLTVVAKEGSSHIVIWSLDGDWVKISDISMPCQHIDFSALQDKLLLYLFESLSCSCVLWNTETNTTTWRDISEHSHMVSMRRTTLFLKDVSYRNQMVLQARQWFKGFKSTSTLAGLSLSHRGKARDTYDGGDVLVLVTTDRFCAFDRVLALIPFRGQVLNELSLWWFNQTRYIAPNAVLSAPDQNVTIVRKCDIFPVEFAVWRYVTGSLWMVYQDGVQNYCGNALPHGLVKNQKLESNILTLTSGDASMTPDEIVNQGLMTREDLDEVSSRALSLFQYGQNVAEEKGLLLVDAKYKFGKANDGTILLIDEVHTPESSTFWIADSYVDCIENDLEPENFDKEFLRVWYQDHCNPSEDKDLPRAPKELVYELALRYIFLYETITGCRFDIPNTEVGPRISQNVRSALANLDG